VFIEVTDTGCGMDNATRERMFDPFFTTKFTGRGLGMAAVIGIVRSHSGAVFVDSKVDDGTSIRVLFPVHSGTERVAYLTPPEPETMHHDGEWTGRGVALVVDDESSVRTLAKQVLEKRGFTVVTASDGSEGIEMYKQNRNDLAIVLLDLTMPKVGGVEAMRAMRNIRADVPIIFSSGYNESNALDQDALASAAGFIQKPYRASALSDKVREVLFAPAAILDQFPETNAR
jgi:CheY-like chemotaxis protein